MGKIVLFLSYAEEDGKTAREIARRLSKHGVEVFWWQHPQNQGGRFIERIEEEINRADAFLALLSPSYLASTWCRLERELAMHREQDRRACGIARTFIYVLKILDGPYQGAGFLRNYNWVDVASPKKRETALLELAQNLRPGKHAESETAGVTIPSRGSPLFRNRQDELKRVVRGLTNVAGPHFWLVLAPPQLGKTWLLDRLTAEVLQAEPDGWVARLLDLREQPPDVRGDAGGLLALLFRLAEPITAEPQALLGIAQDISRSGKSYLCLLDSAELLDEETANTLRSCLSQIHRLVQSAGHIEVRLALIGLFEVSRGRVAA
jgi:hypothetical protein